MLHNKNTQNLHDNSIKKKNVRNLKRISNVSLQPQMNIVDILYEYYENGQTLDDPGVQKENNRDLKHVTDLSTVPSQSNIEETQIILNETLLSTEETKQQSSDFRKNLKYSWIKAWTFMIVHNLGALINGYSSASMSVMAKTI